MKMYTCRHPSAMLCVLWLGSSVGNLKPAEAVGFFQSMQASAGANTQVPSSQPIRLILDSWLQPAI